MDDLTLFARNVNETDSLVQTVQIYRGDRSLGNVLTRRVTVCPTAPKSGQLVKIRATCISFLG